MKKFFMILTVLMIMFCTVVFADVDLGLLAKSAILIEETTGQTIYEQNANEKLYPASTTKILTALIVLEECKLDEQVKITKECFNSLQEGASVVNLREGETFTVEQLLYAMLVASGNDAANALAIHVAGSVQSFSTIMNTRAKELGAGNSNFVNPNGLHDNNHYTTAYDLSLITKEAMKNETFKNIVKTTKYTLPKTDIYNEERIYETTNLLLLNRAVPPNSNNYYYEYTTGIKTGTTTQAGSTLVASAQKDGMNLICVLLDVKNSSETANRYFDAKKLFTYGFNNFSMQSLNIELPAIEIEGAKNGAKLEIEIENASNVLVNSASNLSNAKYQIKKKEGLMAPITKGSVVGTVVFELDEAGTLSPEYNIIAKDDIKVKGTIGQAVWKIFKTILKIFFCIILVLIVLAIVVRIVRKNIKRNRRKKQGRRYK